MVVKAEGERGMRDEGHIAPAVFVPPHAHLYHGGRLSPRCNTSKMFSQYLQDLCGFFLLTLKCRTFV